MAQLLVQQTRFTPGVRSRDWIREQVLLSLGEAAVAPLAAELSASEPVTRRWAANLLRQVKGAEEPAAAALRPLSADPDPEVRFAVGQALAAVKDAQALEILLPLANSGVPWMRYGALHALGGLGDPRAIPGLVRAFQDPDVNIRMRAASALQALGEPAVGALIELGQTGDSEARASVLHCLRQIGSHRAAPMAASQLEDPDKYVRAAAISCLTRVLPQIGRSVLQPHVVDPEPWVRRVVCEALGELGEPGSILLLLQRLKEDDDIGVRAAAARALGKCGDGNAAVTLLHLLLAEEDCSLLEAALEALAEIGDARILELIGLFEPRRVRRLSRKERTRLERKASFAAGRIRFRLK
jgi:HEAT repeat protein